MKDILIEVDNKITINNHHDDELQRFEFQPPILQSTLNKEINFDYDQNNTLTTNSRSFKRKGLYGKSLGKSRFLRRTRYTNKKQLNGINEYDFIITNDS